MLLVKRNCFNAVWLFGLVAYVKLFLSFLNSSE